MDIDDEDREADSRARSAEILARTEPTEAELLEQQERAMANRLARIMARPDPVPPAPPVVVKIRPDALQVAPDRDGQSGSARAVAQECSPCATAQTADADQVLAQRWHDLARAVRQQPNAALMVDALIRELAVQSVVERRQRDRLEARIAVLERRGKRLKRLKRRIASLEAGRKPRVRIPARRLEVVQ